MQSEYWKTESTADGTDYSNRAGNYLRCLDWINLLSLNLLAGILYFYLGNEIKNHRNRPRLVALWLCGLVIPLSIAVLFHITVHHPGHFQILIFRMRLPSIWIGYAAALVLGLVHIPPFYWLINRGTRLACRVPAQPDDHPTGLAM